MLYAFYCLFILIQQNVNSHPKPNTQSTAVHLIITFKIQCEYYMFKNMN